MELVSSIIQSPDVVVQVILLVDLCCGFPEHFRVHLRVWEAHVVGQVSLHLGFAHTFKGEDLWVLRLGSSKHCFGISGGVDDAGLV